MSDHRRRAGGSVLSVAAVVGTGLFLYGCIGSYESLVQLAAAHHVPVARLVPVGLDGALAGFMVIDICATLAGRHIRALHTLVRMFAAASVWFNVLAGLPDPVSAGFRLMAPLLILILSEVLRIFILKGQRDGRPIPGKRWLLAPGATFRMWRRMHLWEINDYSLAVAMELSRLHAMEQLQDRFGRNWRKQVPGSLLWCLEGGVRIDEALREVAKLTAPKPPGSPNSVRSASPNSPRRTSAKGKRTGSAKSSLPEDLDTQAAALELLSSDPSLSGKELGIQLGVSERYGQMLKKSLAKSAPDTGPFPAIRD